MEIIKKSSLNPGLILVSRPAGLSNRSGVFAPRDRVALIIATCGIGFMPIVPATFGSALGVGIYLLLGTAVAQLHQRLVLMGWNFASPYVLHLVVAFLVVAATSVAGVWASSRAERVLRQKDPRPVIIDEIAGQLVAFLLVPFASTIWTVVAGFVLFRAFDILKPYPVNRLESLNSGFGIMADDLGAGAYAALFLWLFSSLF
jgi:phosphatidylglycerophosphatase A